MSDRRKNVVLPPRKYLSSMTRGLLDYPCDITLLTRIHYSGIAVFRSLYVWQDDISKQVFWWAGDIESGGPALNNDNESVYGCYSIVPSCLEQFWHFFLGWGCEYHYDNGCTDDESRQDAYDRIAKAVLDCPLTEEEIYKSMGYS